MIRRFGDTFTLDEYLVSRADFTDDALEATKSELRQTAALHGRHAEQLWQQITASQTS